MISRVFSRITHKKQPGQLAVLFFPLNNFFFGGAQEDMVVTFSSSLATPSLIKRIDYPGMLVFPQKPY